MRWVKVGADFLSLGALCHKVLMLSGYPLQGDRLALREWVFAAERSTAMLERTDSHDPAFPIFLQHIEPGSVAFYGLSKREYFAAMAMQGLSAAHIRHSPTSQDVASWAVS